MLRDGTVGLDEATGGVEGVAAGRWCGVESEAGHEQRCDKLHRRLKRIVKARGALDAQEAEALREAERLRMWRFYGYSSLLEYMEMEMGYTPRAALERLRVAKALVELPAIAEAMAQGDLSFSAGRELTRVATAETEEQWLEEASDKNLRQVEELVSGHKHGDKPTDPVDPKLRKRRLRYDELDQETVALMRQARQILERELGERVDDNAFLRTLARMVVDGVHSPERTRAPYQVAVTICGRCQRGTQDGAGLVVDMSPPAVEVALCDAEHIGPITSSSDHAADESASADRYARRADISADESPSATQQPHRADVVGDERPSAERHPHGADVVGDERPSAERHPQAPEPRNSSLIRAKQDIPPALRRKVMARDHGTCRVPWCRSSRNIDLHHMQPRSQGGQHSLENLIVLCESHHIARHEGSLLIAGTASDPTFTRRAHNSFAIAERAVETRLALQALGFKQQEIAAAMKQTRTHVGTSEMPLEQWIQIALSYCPKPRAS